MCEGEKEKTEEGQLVNQGKEGMKAGHENRVKEEKSREGRKRKVKHLLFS